MTHQDFNARQTNEALYMVTMLPLSTDSSIKHFLVAFILVYLQQNCCANIYWL